jgi:hypothetical protein
MQDYGSLLAVDAKPTHLVGPFVDDDHVVEVGGRFEVHLGEKFSKKP